MYIYRNIETHVEMTLGRGDPSVFFTRPLSLVSLLITFAMLVIIAPLAIRLKREDAFHEENES